MAVDSMEHKSAFWKGVSAGFLAGMAVAAALRYTPLEKFISNLSTVDGKLDNALGKMEVKLGVSPEEVAAREFFSQTAASQTPGETEKKPAAAEMEAASQIEPLEEPLDEFAPSTIAAARTGAVASFLRNGATPANRATAARYPVPGIDLPRSDHIDLTRPSGSSPRNFDLGSAG